MLVDAAAAVGVPLAEISDETGKRMEALLDPGLPPVNPLDFWGTGRDSHEIITGCVRALLEDPAVAALAFSVDLTSEEHPEMGYIAMARETFPETAKPFAMLSNFSSGAGGDVDGTRGVQAPVRVPGLPRTRTDHGRLTRERRGSRALGRPPVER